MTPGTPVSPVLRCADCRRTKNLVSIYAQFVCGVCVENAIREVADDRAAVLAAKNDLVRGLWAHPLPYPTHALGGGI